MSLYAALHRGHPGDRAFYLAQCRGAETVLELGVGYGRLAVPLAEAGYAVTGIDIDATLLAQAAAAAEAAGVTLELVHGDMTELSSLPRFDRILIPYSGLHCLLDDAAVRRCLAGVARHLAPRGRLVLDTYLADDLHHDPEAEPGEGEPEPLVELVVDGRRFDVTEQVTWSREAQRLDTTYRFVPRDGGASFQQHIPQRYLLIEHLNAHLGAAGLRVVEAHGGFAGEPLNASAELRVLVAEAAG